MEFYTELLHSELLEKSYFQSDMIDVGPKKLGALLSTSIIKHLVYC